MRTIIITGASGGLAQEMVKLLPHDLLIWSDGARLSWKNYMEKEKILT